jgi:hypothetical protein
MQLQAYTRLILDALGSERVEASYTVASKRARKVMAELEDADHKEAIRL